MGVPLIISANSQPRHFVRILFGGDTCHGESYASGGARVIAEGGYQYSLQDLLPLIRRADYSIVNLETPITGPNPESAQDKDYVHWSLTQSLVALSASGIDAVGLANNHTLDYGRPGLAQTIDALRAGKISLFGAGGPGGRRRHPDAPRQASIRHGQHRGVRHV